MLPKKYRLQRDQDIKRVLAKGQIFFSPFFNLKILENHLADSRFTIITSLKISKKAVVRNKAKRQLRAIIYDNLASIKSGFDLVVLTKPAVTITKFSELNKNFVFLLKKTQIFKVK